MPKGLASTWSAWVGAGLEMDPTAAATSGVDQSVPEVPWVLETPATVTSRLPLLPVSVTVSPTLKPELSKAMTWSASISVKEPLTMFGS